MDNLAIGGDGNGFCGFNHLRDVVRGDFFVGASNVDRAVVIKSLDMRAANANDEVADGSEHGPARPERIALRH